MKTTDNFPSFKPINITFTKRRVPKWARPFQRFGLFKDVGEIIEVNKYKVNLFVNSGKTSLLEGMSGEAKGEVTYLALGEGTDVPALTDTTLVTELYRKIITYRSVTGLTLYTSTFIPSSEGSYTYTEAGLFGDDATAVTDSGTLFTRLIISETKTALESITVDYDIISS